MDLFFVAYCAALFALPILLYKLTLRSDNGCEKRTKDWYYALKRLLCYKKMSVFMSRCVKLPQSHPQAPTDTWEEDLLTFHGVDLENNSIYLRFAVGKMADCERSFAEILLQLRLADGRTFTLPEGILLCSLHAHEWRTKVLSIKRLLDGNYRLIFNGFLREITATSVVDSNKVGHVAFNYLFSRGSCTMMYPQFFDRGSFADAVCRVQWRDGNWTDKLGDQVGESSFGLVHGKLRSASFALHTTMALPAYQSRRFGTADRYECSRSITMLTLGEDGTLVYAENKRIACNPSAQVRHGAVLLPNGDCVYINDCDLPLPDICGNMTSMTVHVSTPKRQIKAFLVVDDGSALKHSASHWGCGYDVESKLAEATTPTGSGTTSLLFFKRTYATEESRDATKLAPLPDASNMTRSTECILSLDSPAAQNLSLTGGKAQSLSILAGLQKDLGFRVPRGYVITSEALNAHLQPDGAGIAFRIAMTKLKMGAATPENIKSACEAVQALIMNTPMSQKLQSDVARVIRALRLEYSRDKLTYAVRSSAVNEDTDATSAAGQNESYLGCRTEEDVLCAVRKCWASLYAFRSVQYRRHHGLHIETSMGVIVQAMVDSRIAGVLFTCDLDGNPEKIRITSNYGLGESVVSGDESGDLVYCKRTWNNTLSLGSVQVSKKKVKIALGEKGTRTVHLSDSHSRRASICEEEALHLSKIAIQLEEKYRKHLDIEWAFDGDQLVLLQARPVTFLENWTDYELQHEFDTPIFCRQNVFTTANVKEVMPGAMTPLSSSTIVNLVDASIAKFLTFNRPASEKRYLPVLSHHVFIDYYRLLMPVPADEVDLMTRIIDVGVSGHYVTTQAMLRRAIAIHGRTTLLKQALSAWEMMKCSWSTAAWIEEARRVAGEGFPCGETGLNEIVNRIDRHLAAFSVVLNAHTAASRTSMFYQMISMNILHSRDGAEAPTPETFAQVALLFSNGNGVISAEIPADLEAIAAEIRECAHRFEFIEKNPQEAEYCLSQIPEAHRKYEDFLAKHGHRSFREFELMEASWRRNAPVLMQMLQTLVKLDQGTRKAPPLSVQEVVHLLGSRVNKRLLQFLAEKCRSSVVNRERSKSEVVRHIDSLRTGFTLLSARLAQLHILPEADLVYFLTYDEVKFLIRESDPTLISKAMRRRRLYETWNAFKFPEMCEGMPVPSTKSDSGHFVGTTKEELKGTPVCGGRVIARCCCIDSVQNICELQRGDILVTHGTDVGWTPYYPMLSGVVTELGGVISHGAVVAREYGLPCLVGVAGALSTLRTGDRAILDAGAGTIFKLPPGDDNSP